MALRRTRTTGRPTSANGASSFHLWWTPPPPPARSLSVTLEILDPPVAPDLVFWALQVAFWDGRQRTGGGHVGLQWHRPHPGATAVNWGGYHEGGGELDGTGSDLPSATGNPNTRDYSWRKGVAYTLTVEPGMEAGWWRASILDSSSGNRRHIRELHGGGRWLVTPVVWSEVFAPCDAPSVAVRWSDPRMELDDGSVWEPTGYRVTYQEVARGGCSNTDVTVDGIGAIQRTSSPRLTEDGATIPVS